jgi:hypothetical protein
MSTTHQAIEIARVPENAMRFNASDHWQIGVDADAPGLREHIKCDRGAIDLVSHSSFPSPVYKPSVEAPVLMSSFSESRGVALDH